MGTSWRSFFGPFGSREVPRSRERMSPFGQQTLPHSTEKAGHVYCQLLFQGQLRLHPRSRSSGSSPPHFNPHPHFSLLGHIVLFRNLHQLRENCPGSFLEAGVTKESRRLSVIKRVLQTCLAPGLNPRATSELSPQASGRLLQVSLPPSQTRPPFSMPVVPTAFFSSGKSAPQILSAPIRPSSCHRTS